MATFKFALSQTQILRENITIYTWVALGMMATALLYPFYVDISIPKAITTLLSYQGFVLWCGAMFFCGFGLLVRPRWILMWMLPMIVLLRGVSTISFTATVYYLSWVVLPVGTYYRHRIPIIKDVHEHQLAGLLHLIMGAGLLWNPHGSGMDFFYNAIDVFLFGFDPATFYQLLYLCTGILLMSPQGYPKRLNQLLTTPFVVHGLTFIFVIFTVTHKYGIAAPMVSVTLAWWSLELEVQGES